MAGLLAGVRSVEGTAVAVVPFRALTLGEHCEAMLGEVLGPGPPEIADLHDRGVGTGV